MIVVTHKFGYGRCNKLLRVRRHFWANFFNFFTLHSSSQYSQSLSITLCFPVFFPNFLFSQSLCVSQWFTQCFPQFSSLNHSEISLSFHSNQIPSRQALIPYVEFHNMPSLMYKIKVVSTLYKVANWSLYRPCYNMHNGMENLLTIFQLLTNLVTE